MPILYRFVVQVVGHSHGLITEGQQHGDERERVVYGTIPLDPPPLVACQTLAKIYVGGHKMAQDGKSRNLLGQYGQYEPC